MIIVLFTVSVSCHTDDVPTQWKTTITSWEIASSYLILYLLVLILVYCKISFPFKYNCLEKKQSVKITLSISDHCAGMEPLNFINIQRQAWQASKLPAKQGSSLTFPKSCTSSHHVALCCHYLFLQNTIFRQNTGPSVLQRWPCVDVERVPFCVPIIILRFDFEKDKSYDQFLFIHFACQYWST